MIPEKFNIASLKIINPPLIFSWSTTCLRTLKPSSLGGKTYLSQPNLWLLPVLLSRSPLMHLTSVGLHLGGQDQIAGRRQVNENAHINMLELSAVFVAVKHWAHQFRGQTVAVHCDNRTAISYILKEGGTKSISLMGWAKWLLSLVDRWGIVLRPAYLPGMANLKADPLSRGKRVEEWAILSFIAH